MLREQPETTMLGSLQPRRYQTELVNYVSERNGIIYLPTGSGKTFVAIMALKRHSAQLQKTIEEGGKRAIFMCCTVELARQQVVEVRKNTNFRTGFYVGQRNVDSWTGQRWADEIRQNQVLVGTVQIFVNIITSGYIKINDLSVVIIDECHHATKDHPMHAFMHFFQFADQTQLPRVIGLTGVLLKGSKLSNVQQELLNLESTFRGNIVTVSDMEEYKNVLVYSTNPQEKVVSYALETYPLQIIKYITDKIEEICSVIDKFHLGNIPAKCTANLTTIGEPNKKKYIKNILKDFLFQMNNYGLYAAYLAILSPIVEFELKKRQSETIVVRKMFRYAIMECEHICHVIINKLKDEIDDEPMPDADVSNENSTETDADGSQQRSVDSYVHCYDVIMNFSTPKVRTLLIYLKTTFAGKSAKDIRCLLFVQRRYSAKCLYYLIKNFIASTPELSGILKPQFMIGRNSIAPGIESILDSNWNKRAIDSFREGECNLIICSNVLEEGIDVQACNHVITFDLFKSFSSYIQTKGRARDVASTYTMFVPANEKDHVLNQVKEYKEIHVMMRTFLTGRVLDQDPSEDAIQAQFSSTIQPFVTATNVILLPTSAMALIIRYSQTLPTDVFGSMSPSYQRRPSTSSNIVIVELTLPLQSQVKEKIVSDPQPNVKLAKISAALKACKLLYEKGELNEHLLPLTKTECVANMSGRLFQHWRMFGDDVTSKDAGKRKLRQYDQKCPEEFYGAMPVVGEKCYAYLVNYKPIMEKNEYNEHVLQCMKSDSATFAILLNHRRMPRLAEMPLFMNQGVINVHIDSDNPLECIIATEAELDSLRKFHLMIFRDLLQLWKKFLVLDRSNTHSAFLIVPLNKLRTAIDWNLVRSFQRMEPGRTYNVVERQQMIFKPEDYLGMVINKWYSGLEEERYLVTGVRTDLSPQSPFESTQFSSYEDFNMQRFGSRIGRIMQPQQFLLEVRALTSRRNFFINAKSKTTQRFKKFTRIVLIPELCHNFRFPGELWLKALFLPSILHRLNYMLHGENLRRQINHFLNIPESPNYRPKKLIVDTSLKRVTDVDGNAIEQEEITVKKLNPVPPKALDVTSSSRTLCEASLSSEAECTLSALKGYMQPVEYSRRVQTIFPIEIDYYYQFMAGLVQNLSALHIDQEEKWTYCQLEMPKMLPQGDQGQHHQFEGLGMASNNVPCALEDVPLDDKRRIKLLEYEYKHSTECSSLPLSTAEQNEFIAAITTSHANDVFDMERFEILGDAFLKFAVSLYLANKFPELHEGFLTELKSRLVSNRNLMYCLLDTHGDIPLRLCARLFDPKSDWVPPLASLPRNVLHELDTQLTVDGQIPIMPPQELYAMELTDEQTLSGNCSSESLEEFINACRNLQELNVTNRSTTLHNDVNVFRRKDVIADKVLADSTEAILGVCVKNYGIHRTFAMLEFFGICRREEGDPPFDNLLNLKLGGANLRSTGRTAQEIDGFLINHQILEQHLGYHFKDRAFLLQALTHPSFPTNRITGCYQELEFIGDAILDFLISCYIFERNEQMTPGMVTDLRSALVNNITLACICVRHRFHLYLLAENSMLAEAVKRFADFQETQGHRVTSQMRVLMEEDRFTSVLSAANISSKSAKFNLAENVDVPKVLGDIVEALIAAVYLDSRDIIKTWHVVYHLFEQELDSFSVRVPLDPVRELHEHKHANPIFSNACVDEEVVMVKCVFTCLERLVEVNGFGSNMKQAKKCAAKHALRILAKKSG